MQRGNTLVIALLVVALLLIGGGVAFFMTQSQNKSQQVNTEAMQESEDNQGAMAETSPSPAEASEDTSLNTITLTAQNFSFSQKEIRVKKGETVKIVLKVDEGMHDWVLDGLNANTEVGSAGQTVETQFVANEAGEFEYYCSVGNHRQMGMKGTLIVEE